MLLAATVAGAAPLRHEVLDDFGDTAAWQASASDQVRAALRRDSDGSLCLDYDFAAVSGYAVMCRALPIDWPERFDLSATLKGGGGVNDLQFKLADGSGENVWWVNRPNTRLPAALTEIEFRSRHLQFAWGPAADRSLRHTQFVEFVIAAGRDGGQGALCLASLRLQERAPDPQVWPEARVTSGASRTAFDFGLPREFNGVALQWPAGAKALDYDLQASDDGRAPTWASRTTGRWWAWTAAASAAR